MNVVQAQGGGGFRAVSWLKRWGVWIVFLGLVASNVASLLNSTVHEYLYEKLRSSIGLFGDQAAESLMAASVKGVLAHKHQKEMAELRSKHQMQFDKNLKLMRQVNNLETRNGALMTGRKSDAKHTKAMAETVKSRLARGVARNQAAIPAEAVPYIGIGVSLTVTAWDIYDACQTMKDFNALLARLGEDEMASEFCDIRLPTTKEVLGSVSNQWRQSLQYIAADARDAPASVKSLSLEVRAPSTKEVAGSVCPVVRVPYLCP